VFEFEELNGECVDLATIIGWLFAFEFALLGK
jgi:hypothetical protein